MRDFANDPTVPSFLRSAFARVACQLVRTYDDGSQGIINFMSREKADAEFPHHAERIGKVFADGRKLVSVEIVAA